MNDTLSTYNGWSNRETWLASLWLNNDPANYSMLTEATELDASNFEKAEWLESQLTVDMYDLGIEASLWSDLISTAFARVNWCEVIENNQD